MTTPASSTCQRWTDQRHSWRHPSDGGFNPAAYTVEPLHDSLAGAFVAEHHYAGSLPAVKHSYGLRHAGQLVGAAVLSVPMQKSVLTNVFPTLEPYEESLELGRFVLLDEVPANGESWFLGQMWRLAADDGVRGIVSFADPVPRRRITLETGPDGETMEREQLIMPGHVGLIYQATNGVALGRSTRRTLVYVPRQGVVVSARTMQKIRAQERGCDAAEKTLATWGARPRVAGENPARWLRDALEDIGAERVRHPGNHRYAWRIGRTKAERRTVIALPRTPYPKKVAAIMQAELTWMSTWRERHDHDLQDRIVAAVKDAGGTVLGMSGGGFLGDTSPDELNSDNSLTVQATDAATLERCRAAVETAAGRPTTLSEA